MKLTCKNITLSTIRFSDITYSLDPFPEDDLCPEPLCASIRDFGIIHPPMVKGNEESGYQIVTGRTRLTALRRINGDQATGLCLVLSVEYPEFEIFDLILEEIRLHRLPSPIEQTIFLLKISKLIPEEEMLSRYAVSLPLCRKYPLKTLGQLLELDHDMIEKIHRNLLETSTAMLFLKMDRIDRQSLFTVITALNLSFSNQKKLVEICLELARRDRCTVLEIFSREPCLEILNHQQANIPQKTANLMQWLTSLRNPRLTEAERNFRGLVGRLDLPRGVSLHHSPVFEKDLLTLQIDFRNQTELVEKWPELLRTLTDQPVHTGIKD